MNTNLVIIPGSMTALLQVNPWRTIYRRHIDWLLPGYIHELQAGESRIHLWFKRDKAFSLPGREALVSLQAKESKCSTHNR